MAEQTFVDLVNEHSIKTMVKKPIAVRVAQNIGNINIFGVHDKDNENLIRNIMSSFESLAGVDKTFDDLQSKTGWIKSADVKELLESMSTKQLMTLQDVMSEFHGLYAESRNLEKDTESYAKVKETLDKYVTILKQTKEAFSAEQSSKKAEEELENPAKDNQQDLSKDQEIANAFEMVGVSLEQYDEAGQSRWKFKEFNKEKAVDGVTFTPAQVQTFIDNYFNGSAEDRGKYNITPEGVFSAYKEYVKKVANDRKLSKDQMKDLSMMNFDRNINTDALITKLNERIPSLTTTSEEWNLLKLTNSSNINEVAKQISKVVSLGSTIPKLEFEEIDSTLPNIGRNIQGSTHQRHIDRWTNMAEDAISNIEFDSSKVIEKMLEPYTSAIEILNAKKENVGEKPEDLANIDSQIVALQKAYDEIVDGVKTQISKENGGQNMGAFEEIINKLNNKGQSQATATSGQNVPNGAGNSQPQASGNQTQTGNNSAQAGSAPKQIETYPNLSMLLAGADDNFSKGIQHYSKLDLARELFKQTKDGKDQGILFVMFEEYKKSAPADKQTLQDFVKNTPFAQGIIDDIVGSYEILKSGYDLACKDINPQYDISGSKAFIDGIQNDYNRCLVILDRASRAFVNEGKIKEFSNPKTSSAEREKILKKLIVESDIAKKPCTPEELKEVQLRHHNNVLSSILKHRGTMHDLIQQSNIANAELAREGVALQPGREINPLISCLDKYIRTLDKKQAENNETLIKEGKAVVDNDKNVLPEYKNLKRENETFGTYYPLPPDLEKFAKTMKPYCCKNIIKNILKPLMKAFQKVVMGHSVQEYDGKNKVGKALPDIPSPYKTPQECIEVSEKYALDKNEFGEEIIVDLESNTPVTDKDKIKSIKAAIEWVEENAKIKTGGQDAQSVADTVIPTQGANGASGQQNPGNNSQPTQTNVTPNGPQQQGQGAQQSQQPSGQQQTQNPNPQPTTSGQQESQSKKIGGIEIPQSRFEADCFLAMTATVNNSKIISSTSEVIKDANRERGVTDRLIEVTHLLSYLSTTEENEASYGKKDQNGKDARDGIRAVYFDLAKGKIDSLEAHNKALDVFKQYGVEDIQILSLTGAFYVLNKEMATYLLESCSEVQEMNESSGEHTKIKVGDATKVPFADLEKCKDDKERKAIVKSRFEDLINKQKNGQELTDAEKAELDRINEQATFFAYAMEDRLRQQSSDKNTIYRENDDPELES